ncbi:MAG: acetylxylan esterase [Thermoleophilaceae bacterium]|nr:acetylxylan esterase [Thermoleophilaceae bacterium]
MKALALSALALLALPAVAGAGPLGLNDCRQSEGVQQCSGLVKTWDGVPLDTTVTLPSAGAKDMPLVALLHGFGNSKYEYLDPKEQAYTGNAYDWAKDGYAVLTYTARGLWGSCGTPESRLASPAACASGYIHLADTRFEVRDAQHLIGALVDDGTANAKRIGVTGDSYGGGQSMALAALRNRTMQPDGRLLPWRSPNGTPLQIAAAAPVIPWTDLNHVTAPNGSTFTHTITPAGATRRQIGVFKASVANAITAAAQFAIGPGQPTGEPFVPGRPMGYLSPPGVDSQADVPAWVARADAGEPYGDDVRSIQAQLENRSSYSIDSSVSPPPLFMASGFTDDLFPVDEVVRFANRTRKEHPRTPVSLLLGDFGHQRASNKKPERDRLIRDIRSWLDFYVRDKGAAPPEQAVATTQTCPKATPSEGPFTAPDFHALARGEVRFSSGARQGVSSAGGDTQTGAAIDPATGGGDACVKTPAANAPGTANYRLPKATGGGYTLIGAPSVSAKLGLGGADPNAVQIAARLWDVAPDGADQTLVARTVLRPSGRSSDLFQLHPNGWRFEAGHTPKLELLGRDAPYARPSNAAFELAVGDLELRLPVREVPDCTTVLATAAPLRPPGQELAPGVSSTEGPGCGAGTRGKAKLKLRARCVKRGLRVRATVRGGKARRVDFYVRGRRKARDRRAPFVKTVMKRGARAKRVKLTARALLRGGGRIKARRTVRTCRA